MKIEDIKQLPKMYRVIEVELDVLRFGIGVGYGVFEFDTVVKRRVRRVKCSAGWKWQLTKESKGRYVWDYFEADKESINDENYNLGLI